METLRTSWSAYRRRRTLFILIAFIMLLPVLVVILTSGAVHIPFGQIWHELSTLETTTASLVIWQIRLPRIVGALLGGVSLALAGAVLQAVLKNPLASPSTLGISQGAAFGAALAITVAGMSNPGFYQEHLGISDALLVSLSAFLFSLMITAVIVMLSRLRRSGRETIILAGVALSTFFLAGVTLLQYFADETQLAAIVHWSFGDLSRGSWPELAVVAVVALMTTVYYFLNRFNYNAMLAGDEIARSLGVNVERLRFVTMLMASLATASTVAVFGILGFVGLVAPHIGRRLVGSDSRLLFPLTALLGVLLLLLADLLGRALLSSLALPAGIITSFFGTPVFLMLLFGKGEK
jgi:iron complex transport system permease protein